MTLLKLFRGNAYQFNRPYPYRFFFNESFYEHFQVAQRSNCIRTLVFVNDQAFDSVDTSFIIGLYEQYKDMSIDFIQIDYEFNEYQLKRKYSEFEIMRILQLFPPRNIRMESLTRQTLKMIYCNMKNGQNTQFCNIITNFS